MALRVRKHFAVPENGHMRVYSAGDLVDDKDPVVKGHEHLFETVEDAVGRRGRRTRRASVEQATAAPGEKRDVTEPEQKPAKKTAAKKTGE